jgi:F0F1-type ATP synthase assembly protein I
MTSPLGDHGGVSRVRPGSAPDAHADSRQLWAAADSGWVLMVELITATFTWGGIGWLLDRWLGTAPWFLITGFAIGWGTGIYLAWHRFGREDQAGGRDKGAHGASDEEGRVGASDGGA